MSAVGPAGTQPHRRILASAGTGKTYTLVGRYLELIAAGAVVALTRVLISVARRLEQCDNTFRCRVWEVVVLYRTARVLQ